MTAKLAIIIIAAAATGANLLSLRQQRLQAVHDTAAAVERAARLERELLSLRVELAKLTAPTRVETLLNADNTTDWLPIPTLVQPQPLDGIEPHLNRTSDAWLAPPPAQPTQQSPHPPFNHQQ